MLHKARCLSRGKRANSLPFRHRNPLHLEVLEHRWLPSAVFVTTTNNDGPGSLRQAILAVDNVAGRTPRVDLIDFAIPGSGPYVIQLTQPLPAITNPVAVQGETQPGYFSSGRPVVVLDGSRSHDGTLSSGLEFNVNPPYASSVTGLVINNFEGQGILIDSANRSDLTISNCYIGTDASGTTAQGNGEDGIRDNSTVGHTLLVLHNVISGNAGDGIGVGSGAVNGLIESNMIGTDVSGAKSLGNKGHGARLGWSSSQVLDNVISANGLGLRIGGSQATNNLVSGNYIGTDATGSYPLGNAGFGVLIDNGPQHNSIARNVISGNVWPGVSLQAADNNTVTNNYIGVDATGHKVLGNGFDGVWIEASSHNTVGGTTAGAGNVISGNQGDGVLISENGPTTQNTVQGNFIGTDRSGTLNLGNSGNGVTLSGVSGNMVGGTVSGAGNFIAYNVNGVVVDGAGGNPILENSIFDHNNGFGIRLVNGGNQNLASPVLTVATSGKATVTTIAGDVQAKPYTSLRLEFFANPVANPSGFGEGKQFLGSSTVRTDNTGTATFTVSFAYSLPAGQFVSATATDPAQDTSAFSKSLVITTSASTLVTTLADSGPGSLRDLIATASPGSTVTFLSGLGGTITLTSGPLTIGKPITIGGPGPGVITVSGNHASRVFQITAGVTVTIAGLSITNGNSPAVVGGGISNDGTLTLVNSTIAGNFASPRGGGIYNSPSGTLTLNGCMVLANFATHAGGGIFNDGTLTVTNSTLSSNGSTDADGGAIYNQRSLTVSYSTFSANGGASAYGGAVRNDGFLRVMEDTFAGNTADLGGALYNVGTLIITNSTVAGNTAVAGGGIENSGGVLLARNVIVAGNTASKASGPDLNGSLFSLGHNLIGIASGGSGFVASDLLNVNPLLGLLQNNGGPTETMALLPGSPAIDAGDNTDAPAYDQRGPGYPRIVNGRIDIGAFEVQPGPAAPSRVRVPVDGSSGILPAVSITTAERTNAAIADTVTLAVASGPSVLSGVNRPAIPTTIPHHASDTSLQARQDPCSVDSFFAQLGKDGSGSPSSLQELVSISSETRG